LYALGALAVVLPILFHLIQRRPRGQLLFSSLMFLTPSQPRITRRSRLNHLLLLLLRATALILLALAFTRPFLRMLQQLTAPAGQRHVAILLDRSASMQRQGLWDQANEQIEQVLSGLGATDRVALYSFDDRWHEDVAFDQGTAPAAASVDLVRGAAQGLRPGWGATDLGTALTDTADRLRADTGGSTTSDRLIVLISDLQQGARLDALQTAVWPPDVRVDVRRVQATPGNATLHWMAAEEAADPSLLRVRVSNDSQTSGDTFQLVWQAETAGAPDVPAKSVQVPPGRARVVTLPRRGSLRKLTLRGDPHAFDNTAYLAGLQPVEKHLLFVGDQRDERERQLYFLNRTQLGTLQHPVRIATCTVAEPPDTLNPLDTPLVIVAQSLNDAWSQKLGDYLQQGGRVLVLMDPAEFAPGQETIDTQWLASLLQLGSLQASVATADSYALLTQIDFQHPLFQPLADARFNDFTKIRFWRYHRLTTDHEQPWSVLARYDDHTVALVEKNVGPGLLWIFTSGWSAETSQLALSTKFVPLLVTMLGPSVEPSVLEAGLLVGQTIDLSQHAPFAEVIDPRGRTQPLATAQPQYDATDQPGIYRFVGTGPAWEVAVNLEPAESRTAPLDLAELQQRGVLLGDYESSAEIGRRERQMRDVELESHQKIWRWLLAAALMVMALETYVAGRVNRDQLVMIGD
jgi:hypothetical protein